MTHDLPTTSSSAVKTRFITHHEHLRRPFSWFHPTLAEFHHEHNPGISESPQVTQSIQPFQPIASPALKIYSKWNSRASRKRRYPPKPIQVCYLSGSWSGERISDGAQSNSGPSPPLGETKGRSPRSPSNGWMVTEQRLKHPSSELKVHLAWDISFWVAIVFILGSTAWVGCLMPDSSVFLLLLTLAHARPFRSSMVSIFFYPCLISQVTTPSLLHGGASQAEPYSRSGVISCMSSL